MTYNSDRVYKFVFTNNSDYTVAHDQGSKMRFLDTMSLHMAISGLTSFQRTLWMASRYGKRQGLQEVKQHMKKLRHRPEGPAVCRLPNS